jgi:hypothetical protein
MRAVPPAPQPTGRIVVAKARLRGDSFAVASALADAGRVQRDAVGTRASRRSSPGEDMSMQRSAADPSTRKSVTAA